MSTTWWKHPITGSHRTESAHWRGGLLALVALVLAGCVSYEAQPQDPLAILRELEEQVLPTRKSDDRSRSALEATEKSKAPQGLTARQAAGWAVTHNPSLVALRADLGIAEVELVRAGLLPDPVVGFDAMDVFAEEWTGGTAHKREFLSGAGISWRVPRPGEIDARVGGAKARKEEVRQRILTREWRLVQGVHLSFMDVLAAQERLDLNSRVLATARRTADFFKEAKEVKGATAIQMNLALIEQSSLEQDRIRLEGELRRARQALNSLLGLPPEAEVPLQAGEDPFALEAEDVAASELVERAVKSRPDLKQLAALYEEAEEVLRLEIAKQWPEMSIGTAIAFVLPIFSRFNRPAITAALARRERVGRELRAAVHELRAEIYNAVTVLKNATREVQMFEKTLIPQVQESLQLTNDAFRVREVTLVEILTAQRQSLDSQQNYLEARIRRAQAKLMLDTIGGQVLTEGTQPPEKPVLPEKEKR